MPTEQTWQEWLERLYNLRRDKRGSHERPHKPALLLAIHDLLDRGQVKANEIALTPELVRTFRRYFDVVRQEDDRRASKTRFISSPEMASGKWSSRVKAHCMNPAMLRALRA